MTAVAPLGGRFASPIGGRGRPLAPQVDEARNHLLQDLLYSQAVTRLGFVTGAGRANSPGAQPAAADPGYVTDGLRAVMVFERRPVALSQIQFFDWEHLADYPERTVETTIAR